MKGAPFSFGNAALLISAAAVLFALSMLLHAYGGPEAAPGDVAGPGAYSRSAIGYSGLHDLLKAREWEVIRGIDGKTDAAGRKGVLVVGEPNARHMRRMKGMLPKIPRLLLVLPKWRGEQDSMRPAWLADSDGVPLELARETLGLIDEQGGVSRERTAPKWSVNAVGVEPAFDGIVQLARSDVLRPLVGDGERMLLGEAETERGTVWVLSDPDVLANHGLARGDNAAFALALLARLSGRGSAPGSVLVFDETVHGFQARKASPLKMLFGFPTVVATALACLSALVLVFAASGRFGPPRRARPAADYGKGKLIDNSARLLEHSGHRGAVLARYVEMIVRQTARALHAPGGLRDGDLFDWLDGVGRSRGAAGACRDIVRRADGCDPRSPFGARTLMECARDAHRWKGEMIDGAGKDPRHGRRRQD